jgi:DNA-binding CsgD family transcriptional regulator
MDKPFISQQYELTTRKRIFWDKLLLSLTKPPETIEKTRAYRNKYVRMKNGEKKTPKIYLRKDETGIFFSGGQANCMYWMLHGITKRAELALKINLSQATVKWYKYHIKKKMRALSEKDMINRVRHSNFLENYNKIYQQEDIPKEFNEIFKEKMWDILA